MSTPWMIRRRVGWYLRLRIPADLAPLIGSHLVRSLKTNDRRMAQARAARAVAASEAAWQEARTMMHTWMGVPTPQVDTEAIDAAISDWPRAEREYDGLPPDAQAQIRERLTAVLLGEMDARDAIADRLKRGRAIMSIADEARHAGLVAGLTLALQQGRTSVATAIPPQTAEAGQPWTNLTNRFFLDTPSIGPSTRVSHEQDFRDWEALIGNKSLKHIIKADVKTYADWLRDRVSNRGRPLDRKSIVRLLQHVKSFLSWCTKSGFIEIDPGDSIQARSQTRAERDGPDKRRAFTPAELTTLFASPLFAGCANERQRSKPGKLVLRDEKYWFFLTALFTGARTDEIAQAPSRLHDLDGTLCLDLRNIATKPAQA